jgi:anti-anti-sigma factor
MNVTTQGDALILSPRGDIDLTGSPHLKVELKRLGATKPTPGRIIVDLAGVSYMDSSGLATLVEALQASRKGNYKLVVCGLQPRVRAIFDIAKLAMVFTIVQTLDQALTA